jgi:hypothetical protein
MCKGYEETRRSETLVTKAQKPCMIVTAFRQAESKIDGTPSRRSETAASLGHKKPRDSDMKNIPRMKRS